MLVKLTPAKPTPQPKPTPKPTPHADSRRLRPRQSPCRRRSLQVSLSVGGQPIGAGYPVEHGRARRAVASQ